MFNADDLFDRINDGVQEERLHAIRKNILSNHQFIERFGGIRPVVSALAAKHCIIAGAGSSLDSAMDGLHKIYRRSNVAIIATDMSFAALVKNGIIPHYVISCETTPRDFFAVGDTSRTGLLAFSGVCSRIVREWRGAIYFYNWMIRSEPYESLWKLAGIHLGFAATGSVVTTQAVSIALGCGVSSLSIIGNDLGFKDSFYSRGASRSGDFARTSSRVSPLSSVEFSVCRKARHYIIKRDKTYYTNHQFLAAKKWLEDLFSKQQNIVYDSSIPGCAGKNIVKITFNEYCKKMLDTRGGSK